jgi:hypothetical protein
MSMREIRWCVVTTVAALVIPPAVAVIFAVPAGPGVQTTPAVSHVPAQMMPLVANPPLGRAVVCTRTVATAGLLDSIVTGAV